MQEKTTTYAIPPFVEQELESVIAEVNQLRVLVESLAQSNDPLATILREAESEVMQ